MEPLPKIDHQLSKSSIMYGILCAWLSEPWIDITYPGRIMMANSIKVCLLGISLIVDGSTNMFCQHRTQKLPKCLHKWLFPPDGQTRDLPTLQVSLGSNDEFFASDKLGKLSSRDPCCQAGEERPPPRMAQVARNVIRTKSYTVSNPTLLDGLHSKPTLPVIQR
jgi:hypothetical protein